MDIAQLLPYQRSLFILGDTGSERYSLFSSYSSKNAYLDRIWHPEDSAFRQSTIVLFSFDEPLCLEWKDHTFKKADKLIEGGTYFISILPGQLPVNTKLVFPPYFTTEDEFKAYYEGHDLLADSSAFVWFEGFPYGKADTVQQLRYLQDIYIPKQKISIAITQIERKFVITDIGNIQLGVENARRYFLEKGYRILEDYALMPLQRTLLLEALRYEPNYVEQIMKEKYALLENLQANLLFLEDDIQFAVENDEWIMKLEDCFSYKYVQHGQSVFDVWNQRLSKLFNESLFQVIKKELAETYELNRVQKEQSIHDQLTSIIHRLWKEVEQQLRPLKRERTLLVGYTDRLQYEMATIQAKAKCSEVVNQIVKTRLPTEVHCYLNGILKKYIVSI